MFSIKKIYGYIFLLSLFPVQILCSIFFRPADELVCISLFCLAALDIYNSGLQALRRYKVLLIVLAVMVFYAFYSLVCFHFNTPSAIISDFISEIKPFAVFGITLALGTSLDGKTKGLLRLAALANTIFLVLTFVFWLPDYSIFGLPANFGAVMLLSSWAYLYGSLDEGRLSQKDKWIVVAMLVIGLMCTRSKYYGEFLLMIFLLFGYRSGMQRHITLKGVLITLLILLLVLAVAWNKIHYYFIEGSHDVFNAAADDDTLSDNFARPVLYAVAAVLFVDFFPFGTGLASYASFASAESYSSLYYDYGMSLVHGLSPDYPAFICDAYYPTLAQFGIAGVILFFLFWYWIVRKLNAMEKERGESFRYSYIIGMMVVAFVFIESIASTFFVQGHGMMAMMFLGLILTEKKSDHGEQ